MFNLEEAVAYIEATLANYFDGDTQLKLRQESHLYREWMACLHEDGAADPHIAVHGAPSMEAAIIRLACAIREESDIGG